MKIMSFNTQHCLNYVTRKIDFEVMAKAIIDCNADVVGLNEMRGLGTSEEYKEQVEILARLTGMQYFYFGKAIDTAGGPYGNGILSKIPIVNVKTVLIPDPNPRKYENGYYETRCVIVAELEVGITVLVTHFGLYSDEQENAVKTIVELLPEEKCILMGDFNVTPEDSILAPIRAKMKDTADNFDAPKQSFPSDNPDRKIDYIFVSSDMGVEHADIPPIVASDHRPHIAIVNI